MKYNKNLTSIVIGEIITNALNLARDLREVEDTLEKDYTDDERVDFFMSKEEVKLGDLSEIINNPNFNNSLTQLRCDLSSIGTLEDRKFLLRFNDYIESPSKYDLTNLSIIADKLLTIEEEEWEVFLLNYKKAYTYFITALSDILEVNVVLETGELCDELKRYQSDYNFNIMDFCEYIKEYTTKNRIIKSELVLNNEEFFNQCLLRAKERYSIDENDFRTNCESLMFYDFVLLKAGELEITEKYIERLKERIDNPNSVYNIFENICQVEDALRARKELNVENCMLLYQYENLIDDKLIADIVDDGNLKMLIQDRIDGMGHTSHFN